MTGGENHMRPKGNLLQWLDPVQQFLKLEAAGGIVLLLFTFSALFMANTPLSETYHNVWHIPLDLGLGPFRYSDTLHHFINDGLMAVFFLLVGLEIKREVITGELSTWRKAVLPIAAATGGMVVPALTYSLLNNSPDATGGWAIPMATDIAFSLAVLNLIGKRVPVALKIFLLAYAIVDDMGAIVVIAVFFSASVSLNFIVAELPVVVVLLMCNMLRIRNIWVYLFMGLLLWYFILNAGIHPTLAGVILAFAIPVGRRIKTTEFRPQMAALLDRFRPSKKGPGIILSGDQIQTLEMMENQIKLVKSPLQSLENRLHKWVAFGIMPLFAFANAGVTFEGNIFHYFLSPLAITIALSLIAGKVVGITLFSFAAVKSGIASLAGETTWAQITGIGLLGGMGFTMSLFISNLSLAEPGILNAAKTGILAGSFISGILGFILLNITLKHSPNT